MPSSSITFEAFFLPMLFILPRQRPLLSNLWIKDSGDPKGIQHARSDASSRAHGVVQDAGHYNRRQAPNPVGATRECRHLHRCYENRPTNRHKYRSFYRASKMHAKKRSGQRGTRSKPDPIGAGILVKQGPRAERARW